MKTFKNVQIGDPIYYLERDRIRKDTITGIMRIQKDGRYKFLIFVNYETGDSLSLYYDPASEELNDWLGKGNYSLNPKDAMEEFEKRVEQERAEMVETTDKKHDELNERIENAKKFLKTTK